METDHKNTYTNNHTLGTIENHKDKEFTEAVFVVQCDIHHILFHHYFNDFAQITQFLHNYTVNFSNKIIHSKLSQTTVVLTVKIACGIDLTRPIMSISEVFTKLNATISSVKTNTSYDSIKVAQIND